MPPEDTGSQQVSIDLRLQGADAHGTLGPSGQTVEVLCVGGKFYMRAPAAAITPPTDALDLSQLAGG